jgi:hypothetical protein
LDLYAKYFWTRQQGTTVNVPVPVSFENVDSHRLRAGARVTHSVTETIGVYGGAAYEREFGGAAKARSQGLALEAPDLQGNVGIGELGVSALAGEHVNLDFGLQGNIGARKGVSGSLRINFAF